MPHSLKKGQNSLYVKSLMQQWLNKFLSQPERGQLALSGLSCNSKDCLESKLLMAVALQLADPGLEPGAVGQVSCRVPDRLMAENGRRKGLSLYRKAHYTAPPLQRMLTGRTWPQLRRDPLGLNYPNSDPCCLSPQICHQQAHCRGFQISHSGSQR